MNTQEKGQLAQLKVEQRALEKGFIASKPTMDARYDLIVDDGIKLLRAQIKYVDSSDKRGEGTVRIYLRKVSINGKKRIYKKNEVDILIAYIPRVNSICCIPVELFDGKAGFTLRYLPPKNNQSKHINFIEKFLW